MNEHSLVAGVHKRLPSTIYKLKLNVRFHKGVADAWYSGGSGDMWVEYKWIASTPVRPFVPANHMTALQRHWLNGRLSEGRRVALVIGTPKGAFILEDGAWEDELDPAQADLIPNKEISKWIERSIA